MRDTSDKAPEPGEAPTHSSEVARAFRRGFKFGAFFSIQLGMAFTLFPVLLFVNRPYQALYIRAAFAPYLVLSLILSSAIFFAFIKSNSRWRSVASKPWQRFVIGCAVIVSLFLFVLGSLCIFIDDREVTLTTFLWGYLAALIALTLGGGLVGAVMSALAAVLSDHTDLEEESVHPLDT